MLRSVYYVFAYCDRAECFHSDSTQFTGKVPDEEARKKFRELGWKFADGRTECPRHEARAKGAA